MSAIGLLTTNQAVGSSTSRVAAKNAGFAGGPKGEGTARVISPGTPSYKTASQRRYWMSFLLADFFVLPFSSSQENNGLSVNQSTWLKPDTQPVPFTGK
jgi:hypothetical protein